MRWKVLLALLVLAVLGGLFYFNRIQWGGPPMGPMPIYAAPVISQTYLPSLQFTGRISAAAGADIYPQTTGVLEKILVTEGQMVKAGEPLFTLNLRTYNAQAQAAAAQYTQARAAYSRGQELRKADAISVADLEARKATYQAAAAASQGAGIVGNIATVSAPISGRVGRTEQTIGNVVTPQTLLTSVQQISPLYVDFDLPEQVYLSLMAGADGEQTGSLKGTPVQVGLANNNTGAEAAYPYTATLTGLDNQLGAASGALRVRATLANPQGALLPGLFARVKVAMPNQTETLLVNEAAIGTDQTLRFVYKLGVANQSGPQPVRVPVKVGDLVGGLRGVTAIAPATLSVSDSVVVNGLMRIRPGMEVQPFPADMRTAQPISGSAPIGRQQ